MTDRNMDITQVQLGEPLSLVFLSTPDFTHKNMGEGLLTEQDDSKMAESPRLIPA